MNFHRASLVTAMAIIAKVSDAVPEPPPPRLAMLQGVEHEGETDPVQRPNDPSPS